MNVAWPGDGARAPRRARAARESGIGHGIADAAEITDHVAELHKSYFDLYEGMRLKQIRAVLQYCAAPKPQWTRLVSSGGYR
jgi:hypothetical protein